MPFFQKILFSKLVVLVFLLIAGSVSTSSNTLAQSSVYNQQRLQGDLIRRQQDALRRQQEEARRRAAAEERRRQLQRQRQEQERVQRERRQTQAKQRRNQQTTANRRNQQNAARRALNAQQQARNARIQQRLKRLRQGGGHGGGRGPTGRVPANDNSLADVVRRQGIIVRQQRGANYDARSLKALSTARRLAQIRQANKKRDAVLLTKAADLDHRIVQSISSPKLKNIVSDLYRASNRIAGGTAGAVRAERTQGVRVGGRDHRQKAQDAINGINKLLSDPNLSPKDKSLALLIRKDLNDALAGK